MNHKEVNLSSRPCPSQIRFAAAVLNHLVAFLPDRLLCHVQGGRQLRRGKLTRQCLSQRAKQRVKLQWPSWPSCNGSSAWAPKLSQSWAICESSNASLASFRLQENMQRPSEVKAKIWANETLKWSFCTRSTYIRR